MLSLAMVGEDGFGEDVCGLNCTAAKIASRLAAHDGFPDLWC